MYFIHVSFFYLSGIYILYFYYFSDIFYILTRVLSLINQCLLLYTLSHKDLRMFSLNHLLPFLYYCCLAFYIHIFKNSPVIIITIINYFLLNLLITCANFILLHLLLNLLG